MAKRRKKGIEPGTTPFSFALPDVGSVVIPNVSELPSWRGVKRLGFDVETKDPDLRELGPGVRRPDTRMVGFSFAFDDGPDFYIPLSHEGGDNVPDPEQALRYLRDQARDYDGDVVGMNLPYEIDWTARYGVEWPKVRRWRDVQVGDVLLDELQQKYTLDAILERHAFAGKEEGVLEQAAKAYGFDPKQDLWRLPGRYVVAYGAGDSRKPLALEAHIASQLQAEGLWEAYELESQVLPVLVRMRRRGVRVSMDRLDEIERWSLQQEALALDELQRITGRRVGIGECMNPSILVPILRAQGVQIGVTESGRDSLDQEVLSRAGKPGELLIRARKLFKLRNTYAAGVRRYVIDGRIHCTFNQMARESDKQNGVVGARWGRMSSSDPNLQNQPSRDEFAKMFKRIYLPEEGSFWGSHDFSRQEPRLIAHYAILCKKTGWEDVLRRYEENPNLDDHQMMADLTGLPRKYAKNIYMGLCYVMGEAKLCHQCGFPTETKFVERLGRYIEVAGEQGRKVFDAFHEHAPFVRELTKMAEQAAKERGYVKLIDGRRCRFPRRKDGHGYDWTHKALNRIIQGGAAVQTKKALVDVDAAGHYIQLAIHDDLAGSVSGPQESERIVEIMINAVALKVPTLVDYKNGPSWGDVV